MGKTGEEKCGHRFWRVRLCPDRTENGQRERPYLPLPFISIGLVATGVRRIMLRLACDQVAGSQHVGGEK